ncbi:MAG: hypothetical protein GF329_05380 [Candidatus Lokiarchaeota archaeon]|nr:hypothetical protein [Candidatus Lokiarchaeota archaeon]
MYLKFKERILSIIILFLVIISFINLFSILNLTVINHYDENKNPNRYQDDISDISISNISNFTTYLEYRRDNTTKVLLNANNTQEFSGTTNTSIIIDNKDWNFSAITLDVYDIWRIQSQVIENEYDEYGSIYESDSGKNTLAQGFNLSAKYCELSEVEVRLAFRGSHTFFIRIFNATYNGTDYIPDTEVSVSNQIGLSSVFGDSGVRTLTFNGDILNKSESEGGIFFFLPDGSFSSGGFFTPYVRWAYDPDSGNGDSGSGYLKISSNNWLEYTIDFYSILEFTEFIFPEDVNMQVNNTNSGYIPISNSNLPGEGKISFSRSINKTNVNIEIVANSDVNFKITANVKLINNTNAITQFKAYYDVDNILINITLFARYFDGSFNRKLHVSIFPSWIINQILINGSLIADIEWEKFESLLTLNSSNGRILVKGSDDNYINNFSTIIDGSITNELFYNKNLTINSSLKFSNSVFPVNLTIRNGSNHLIFLDLIFPTQTEISFSPFNLIKTGEILISTNWFNGTSMGFRTSVYTVKYHADLYNISDNINQSSYFEPGEDVHIDVFFNNTDLNNGIENASDFFSVNMTSQTQYQINEDDEGYYNITIYTDQLSDRNHTFKITVDLYAHQISSIIVKFKVFTTAFTLFNITGYYGNQFMEGKWWVKPDPYFDDSTHKIQVQFQNASSLKGIYPALIYAYPNWTSDVWVGTPFDLTGEYDITLNTEGLNDGDKGEILIVASAAGFETKEITIYLQIDKIPISLLAFDITGYEEITVYEGETFSIAANFRDLFHDDDIVFDNPEEGNVTWSIPGTDASGQYNMDRIITIYTAEIDLPKYNIQGGSSYDLTITGISRENYETKSTNITLNVLTKLEVQLNISTCQITNIRVGQPLCIYSTLKFLNNMPLAHKLLSFEICYYDGTEMRDFDSTTILTNESGIATYNIEEIKSGIDQVIVNVSYAGTEQIKNMSSSKVIEVLDKYITNLTISEKCEIDIRVGRSLKIYLNLSSPELGPLFDKEIQCTILFIYETNLTYSIDREVTNESGYAICMIERIPDSVLGIEIDVSFRGNKTIKPSTASKIYYVEPKYNTSLSIFSDIPEEILIGEYIFIGANLTNLILNEPVIGASVRLHIEFNDPSIESVHVFGTTEENGTTWTNLQIPERAANADSFQVILIYDGSDTISGSVLIAKKSVKIITQQDLFLRSLPNLILFLVIGAASIVAAISVYQIAIVRPRKKKKKNAINRTYQKFLDTQNIQHFILLSKTSGGVLYSYSFGQREFDPDLIAGFLTAIASFKDSSKIKGSLNPENQMESGFVLSYENFIILVSDGKYIRIALILDNKPSKRLTHKAKEFIKHYESKYKSELEIFDGLLKPFRNTNKDIEKIFEVSLLAPHRIGKIAEIKVKELNKLEDNYLNIAALIQKQKEYFSIPLIVDMVKDVRNESLEEIIYIFEKLRDKKIFNPIYIEKLEDIIKNRKLQLDKEPKEWEIELEDKIIPEIKGIAKKKIKILNYYLSDTDPTYQKMISNEVMKTKEDKRVEYINDLIQNWKSLTSQKDVLKNEFENYKQNGDFYNSVIKLDEIRLINEELGFKAESKKVIEDIKELMNEIRDYNETQYIELQERFKSELNKCSSMAEIELGKNNPLIALQYYIACYNLAEQIGDESLIDSYKKIMNDVRIQFNI